MDRSSPEWDLDSDEIASVTSQDLHDSRPNRWTGTQRTWQRLTAEERRLWQSMEAVEGQDLAIHLYNAYALKRRGRDSQTAQDVTVTLENGEQGIWAPPRVWTAWPLNESRVPQQKHVRREDDDGYGRFTFRKAERRMPSSELYEELGATILRLAGERFHKIKAREQRKTVLASIEAEVTPLHQGESQREGQDTSGVSDPSSEDEKMMIDDEGGEDEAALPKSKKGAIPGTKEPVMSSNDDLSYEIIRPSARHILSQLDSTLQILHNARVATTNYASDSSATSDSESDSHSGPKRGRGRPRSTQLTGTESPPRPDGAVTPKASKRGRPRKVHIPHEGETHEEMLIRIARQSHRRLPTVAQDRDAAFEEWLRQGDERLAREEALLREEEELGIEPQDSAQEKRLQRLGLRDWSDVVGAAALAGFSPQVIARTAKRCANLFGQGMVMRRLDEAPASRAPAFLTMEYRPEKTKLGSDEEPDSDSQAGAVTAASSRNTLSRQASLARLSSRGRSSSPFRGRSSPRSASSAFGTPRNGTPRNRSQSKSRSRSRSSAGFHLCPVPTCERSATGFTRRQNLRRHMQLVHPGRGDEDEEWDSEDEMLGAVHVDGFLKPITPARGWRESVAASSLVIRKRGRERRTEYDEGDDDGEYNRGS
ncbi:RNA polymerase I-specific transcription initiation factor domain-containing protein [Trichoderma compactum]